MITRLEFAPLLVYLRLFQHQGFSSFLHHVEKAAVVEKPVIIIKLIASEFDVSEVGS